MKACKIQFKKLGKRYFFSCDKLNLENDNKVIVNTIRGLEVGSVVGNVFEITDPKVISELKEVVRIATNEDLIKYESNKEIEKVIVEDTKVLVKKEKLEMKVLSAEYTLDKSKLIISFESEERVDFRELVKQLADKYKTRIELRQVGARDGAKTFGGIGPCGLIVCCQTFLTEFENVGVKMAKNQNLSLNPVKISGNCGKLLCCINYENDLYTELRKDAPNVGDIVGVEDKEGKVLTCDVLNKTLKVKFFNPDSFGYLTFEDVKYIKPKERKKPVKNGSN